jgi:hypothetical protein
MHADAAHTRALSKFEALETLAGASFFSFFLLFFSADAAHARACSRRSKRSQTRVCVLIQRLCVSAYYVCMYVCVRILDMYAAYTYMRHASY